MSELKGELKVLERLNKYEFAVELWVMRSGINRNKWDYQNLEQHYLSFVGQPILCAFPNGRIGDGHTMEEKTDKNGEKYYSFIGATCEKIVGTISENEDDLQLVERDGETWLKAKGRLFAFYAKELVDNIVAKGVMEVSAETEVFESHMADDGEIEVFTEWDGIGVTILGEGVAPAIPGARIEELAAMRAEYNSILLKAASYIANDSEEEKQEEAELANNEETEKPHTKSNKGEGKTLSTFSKKQLAEIEPKFNGFKVLSALQDDNGIHVCLMSIDGATTAIYTMGSLEDVVVPEKIVKVNAQIVFKADEWEQTVDSCEATDILSAELVRANNALASETERADNAETALNSMKEHEATRRISAAKEKAISTLSRFNANRSVKISNSILEKLNESIDNGDFSECYDENGEWIGEAEVENKVLAACATKVMEQDEEEANRNASHYIWDSSSAQKNGNKGDVADLLAELGIN